MHIHILLSAAHVCQASADWDTFTFCQTEHCVRQMAPHLLPHSHTQSAAYRSRKAVCAALSQPEYVS